MSTPKIVPFNIDPLRPNTLTEFSGQPELVSQLSMVLSSAAHRQTLPEHILFVGPPGTGKTTLANVVANTLGVTFVSTNAAVFEKPKDLVSLISGAASGKQPVVVFIDEIHRIPASLAEILYPVMEDGHLDMKLGEGPAAKTVKISLPPLCIIGATTVSGKMPAPLLDRFGFKGRLQPYSVADLATIVHRSACLMAKSLPEGTMFSLTKEATEAVAAASQFTPRIANSLLQRVRDWALSMEVQEVSGAQAVTALAAFGVDKVGLDYMARTILTTLRDSFNGGPVGLGTLAAAAGESSETVEQVYEPFLMRLGFIQRTRSGRVLTEEALLHLAKAPQ